MKHSFHHYNTVILIVLLLETLRSVTVSRNLFLHVKLLLMKHNTSCRCYTIKTGTHLFPHNWFKACNVKQLREMLNIKLTEQKIESLLFKIWFQNPGGRVIWDPDHVIAAFHPSSPSFLSYLYCCHLKTRAKTPEKNTKNTIYDQKI